MVDRSALDPKYQLNVENTDLSQRFAVPFSVSFNIEINDIFECFMMSLNYQAVLNL